MLYPSHPPLPQTGRHCQLQPQLIGLQTPTEGDYLAVPNSKYRHLLLQKEERIFSSCPAISPANGNAAAWPMRSHCHLNS